MRESIYDHSQRNRVHSSRIYNFGVDKTSRIVYNIHCSRGRGGIGIRARLRGVWATVRVQVPSTAPSALTISAASELIRNDELAFLYAKPGPLPPLSPVYRRNTRLGLHHGPGSFVNLSDQPRRDFNSRGFFQICRVPRVRRVIRVIRVIRVRIGQSCSHKPQIQDQIV